MATIDIAKINNLELGPTGQATLAASRTDGADVTIDLPLDEISSLAPALLSAAAIGAALAPPKEPISVGPGHLPVMQWECGISTINGEPILILTVSGGARLMFQFSPEGAQECGEVLVAKGLEATPRGKPN